VKVRHQAGSQINGGDRDKEIFPLSVRLPHSIELYPLILREVYDGQKRQKTTSSEVSPRVCVLEANGFPLVAFQVCLRVFLAFIADDRIEEHAQDGLVHGVLTDVRVHKLTPEF